MKYHLGSHNIPLNSMFMTWMNTASPYAWVNKNRLSHRTHTHAQTQGYPAKDPSRNLAICWECSEEGVKGKLLRAPVKTTFHTAASSKALHASVAVVKNILDWL